MDTTAAAAAPSSGAACYQSLDSSTLSADQAAAAAALFRALADPNRVRIVNLLATRPASMCVCDFTEPLGISQPTVSHHLKKLVGAGLLAREQRGVWAYYSLDRDALRRLTALANLQGAPP